MGTSKAEIEDTEEQEALDMRQGSETMAQTPIGAGIGDAARMSMTVSTGKHKKSFSRHKLNADRMTKRGSAPYSHTGSVRIRPETAASIQVLFDAPKP